MTVIGDPAGMRALADQLVKYANRLGETRHDVKSRWNKVDMKGPYADAAEAVLKAHAKQYDTAADQLDAAVKTLRRAATEVEAAQEAERKRIAAAEAEAERRRREAVAAAARRS